MCINILFYNIFATVLISIFYIFKVEQILRVEMTKAQKQYYR